MTGKECDDCHNALLMQEKKKKHFWFWPVRGMLCMSESKTPIFDSNCWPALEVIAVCCI